MGIFLLWATWAHEYTAIFVNIDGHRTWGHFKKSWRYVGLIKVGERVNEIFKEFLMVRFSYNQTKR